MKLLREIREVIKTVTR